jgi:hypothetical protein
VVPSETVCKRAAISSPGVRLRFRLNTFLRQPTPTPGWWPGLVPPGAGRLFENPRVQPRDLVTSVPEARRGLNREALSWEIERGCRVKCQRAQRASPPAGSILRDAAGTSYAIPVEALTRVRVSTDHCLSLENFLNGDEPIGLPASSLGDMPRRYTGLQRRTLADPHLTRIWHGCAA